jgi:hypothetical protein
LWSTYASPSILQKNISDFAQDRISFPDCLVEAFGIEEQLSQVPWQKGRKEGVK